MTPKPCPFPLIRIGGDSDGAYLIPDDLADIEACFSPGVDSFKRFEDQLLWEYGIQSYLCDFSANPNDLDTALVEVMQTFEKKWLDVDDSANSITLDNWVAKYVPDCGRDLILQMDIEGAEYRNILQSPSNLLARFRIIVVEVHGLAPLEDGGIGPACLDSCLQKLAQTHVCVHAHPNNCCGDSIHQPSGRNIPRVLELTFLRKDRFGGCDEKCLVPVMLPHPEDIVFNVQSLPPLHLNVNWLFDCKYPKESFAKIRSDYAIYNSVRSLDRTADRAKAIDIELESLREEKEGLQKELGEVRGEKEGLQREFGEVRGEKDGLQRELIDAREESELLLLQLHQVQEELEYYFLENQRKEEKLHGLRGQREVLLRMLRLHGRFQQRFLALDGRIALPSLRRQLMPWWQRLQRS
ncbi:MULTISPECIES: FkbM family methyltransferase [unclassified Cyanobium]|uniref:FkbM family methyltransferase n=1 Tax=unclassified Cyanobium TaxID=2627006 RepID=UPI0020CBDDC3|nr:MULTISPECIES: FkbM family methyltransferase [unclassified Cyanobium]MCP9778590.1 FkbM family methyltransferase [Cyanobium sp. Tous-M-B4]MCP9876222.1 FkbM family methyltransferase [Cyanobium sp. A2C-AMD]